MKGRWAVSAAVLVFALAASLWLRKRAAPASVPAESKSVDIGSLRHSVAVLGFQNASGRPSDAWLSTALAEMLRTELGADGKLHVVPGEDVAQFRVGAPWSETDSLSRQTTSRIGKALDSDLLVLGSFAALGNTPGNDSIRVDFRLQDAQTGEILYEGAEQAGDGKVSEVSVDREDAAGFGILSSRNSGPSRPRQKLRTVQAQLGIAFGGGQV